MPSQQNQSDFITEVQAIINRPGAQRPASSIVKNMDVAAAVSKFVRPREQSLFRPTEPNADVGMINSGIEQISKTIMGRIEDNENIFKLFPDIELAIQIIISSILSPKDMVKSELIYRAKDSALPAQMVSKMVQYVRDEIEKYYKLEDELPVILRDALFKSGSHVKAILPESAVDQLINSKTTLTTESMYSEDIFTSKDGRKVRHLGLLGDPHEKKETKRGLVFESALHARSQTAYNAALYTSNFETKSDFVQMDRFKESMARLVEVTDNFQFLKVPKLIETVNQQSITRLTGSKLSQRVVAAEQYFQYQAQQTGGKPTPNELSNILYKSANTDYTPFLNVPSSSNLRRKSVGRPLVLTLPSEAAIPVHVPGDVSKHIGYFVPVDIDGNPVTVDSAAYDSGQGLSSMLQSDKSNTSLSSLLTEKARRNLGNDGIVPTIEHLGELYADIVERDLIERLIKGAYGKQLQISRNNEIYRIMLMRTLKSQMTRLVYIPSDYITYFAFNFHRNGVGKSYLDDLSNITSLRAMVLFSKVMAKVKSSIATTHVNVTLDQRDHDPVKTIEMAKHLVAKARQQYFPHGLNRVVDLTDWIQRAGIEITFEGHPRLPETKFNFESRNTQHVMPDDDLDELFRHQTYMHFGLSPETVDSAARADFATTIEQNSILFARRILMLSNTFTADITEYARKIISNDETILEGLTQILQEHKADIESILSDEEKELFNQNPASFTSYLIQSFVEVFEVDLPKPDSTRNASQKAAIDSYEEMVDKGLNYIFSSDVLPQEFGGATNEYVEAIKSAWKAALMRRWMADNNYAPELFDITNRSEDGQPMANLLEMTKSYTENIMLNIVSFLNKMKASKEAANKDIDKLNAGDSSGGSSNEETYESENGGQDEFEQNNPFDSPEIGIDDSGSELEPGAEEPGSEEGDSGEQSKESN